MAIINYSDLVGDDGAFDKLEKQITDLENFIKTKGKSLEGALNVVSPEESEQVKKLVIEVEKLKKSQAELNKIKVKTVNTRKKLSELSKAELIQREKENLALREARAEAKAIARIKKTEAGSIENLRAKLALVTVALKNVNVEELENTKRGRRLVKSKTELTASLKRLEKVTGDNRRNVGNYSDALQDVREKLLSFTSALGLAGGVFGAVNLFKSGFKILADYDEALVDVQKTTGQTRQEVELMAKSIREIDTRTSIEDLLGLASAGGRLGLKGQDVVDFTEAVDKAFVSLGDTLGGTADDIGLTLGKISSNFGVDAEFGIGEGITKVGSSLNELGANSKATEDKIIDFTQRLAGLSSQANISVSDVNALGALFDEAGQSIETSSTVINKFLPEIGKDIEKFAKIAGVTEKEFRKITNASPIEALKLVASGAKSTEGGLEGLANTMQDLGIENARAVGIIGVLSNSTERLTELQEISNTAFEEGTSIQSEFEKKNTSLQAEVEKLTKSWQEMVISTDDTNNSISSLKSVVVFLRQNLSTFVIAIRNAVIAFSLMKTVMFAVNNGMRIYRATLSAITLAQGLFQGGVKLSALSIKGFSTAVKGIPFVGIITGITTLISLLPIFTSKTKELTDEQELLNEKLREEARLRKQQITTGKTLIKNYNDIKATASNLDNLSQDQLKAFLANIDEEISANETKNKNLLKNEQKYQEQVQMNTLTKKLNYEGANAELLENEDYTQEQIALLQQKRGLAERGLIADSIAGNDALVDNIRANEEGITQVKLTAQTEDLKNLRKTVKGKIKAERDYNRDAKKIAKDLANYRKRLEDANDEAIKVDEDREIQQLKRRYQREIATIKGNSKVATDLRKALEEERGVRVQEITDKYIEIRLKKLESAREIEIGYIEDETEKSIELERIKSQKILDEIAQNSEIRTFKKLELMIKEYKRLEEFEKNQALQKKLRELESDKLIDEAKVEQTRASFKTQEAYEKFKEEKFLEIKREYLKKRIELLESANNDEFKVEVEQLKAQLANLAIPPESSQWKKFADDISNSIIQISESIENKLQASVEGMEDALNKQEALVEEQRQRAINGQANTLAFEKKEQAKREAQLLASQKRLERIQRFKSYYNTYNANLSALRDGQDSSVALAKTIKDITILEALTAGFKDGGYTGDGGVDRVAGVTHGQEFVIDAPNTKALGLRGKSMKDFKERFTNAGWSMQSSSQLERNNFGTQAKEFTKNVNPTAISTKKIEDGLRDLLDYEKSKPVQQVDVVKMVDGTLEFVEEVRKRNMRKINRYPLKRNRF